jgi:hypothetical protein
LRRNRIRDPGFPLALGLAVKLPSAGTHRTDGRYPKAAALADIHGRDLGGNVVRLDVSAVRLCGRNEIAEPSQRRRYQIFQN